MVKAVYSKSRPQTNEEIGVEVGGGGLPDLHRADSDTMRAVNRHLVPPARSFHLSSPL